MLRKKQNAGFTLIEMMIALLILSIGLLGVATLQVTGQQFNYRAYIRSQATFLAYDMMDRMRANNTVLASYVNSDWSNEGPTPSTNCADTRCNANDIATYDLNRWYQQVDTLLPGGEARIEQIQTTPIIRLSIEIRWIEDRDAEDKKQQGWVFQ